MGDRTEGRLVHTGNLISAANRADRLGLDGAPVENPDARLHRTGKPCLAIPSAVAAHDRQPMAFLPRTGLAYMPARQVGFAYAATAGDAQAKPIGLNTGLDPRDGRSPRDGETIRRYLID